MKASSCLAAALLVLSACGGHAASPTPVRTSSAHADCPMMAAAANATVEDTEGGVAIKLNAPADKVDAVRAHARMMAGHTMMHWPASDARETDVEGGARIDYTAKNPADVAALREHARMHVEKMKSGHCPMM